MSTTDFYRRLVELFAREYPSVLPLEQHFELQSTISPYVIQLDKKVLSRLRTGIRNLYALSRSAEYQGKIAAKDREILQQPPRQHSVLMAYDFHVGEEHDSLIEINTNASMFLVADLVHRAHGDTFPLQEPALQALQESFVHEYQLFSSSSGGPRRIVITDETIREQGRYIEFLMYQELFGRWGWQAEVIDFDQLRIDNAAKALLTPAQEKIDFLYNRYCDFYLDRAPSQHLRQAYLQKWCCVSPNPFEYLVLADKSRLVELASPDFSTGLPVTPEDWATIQQFLLPTYDARTYGTPEQLWADRKKLFFKPKNQYGGKSAYRGEKISRSVFQRALDEDFLVQRFAPPPEPRFRQKDVDPSGWKYDLRLYVYEDQIQNVIARLYRGQLTNFNSEWGGFAAVEFV